MTSPGLSMILDAEQIESTVQRLADELSERFSDGVVLAAVLRGSVPFLADLSRAMSVHSLIDFLAITKYERGTGRVRLRKDLDIDIRGRGGVVVAENLGPGPACVETVLCH